MRSIKHISIIGAGNVATHLGSALKAKGLTISNVYSRNSKRAATLGKQLKSSYTHSIKDIDKGSDLYVLAVPDDAISEISDKLMKQLPPDSWVVHTSGSVGIESIGFKNRGVFYPLQSFSIGRPIVFTNVPLCIYSDQVYIQKKLMALARKISRSVQLINDEERAILHLAAVFSSNFSNHMYHIADQLCRDNELNFNLLKPLIKETAHKINSDSPLSMQTGPARRNDVNTMKKHLKQLSELSKEKAIYKLISENINNSYK